MDNKSQKPVNENSKQEQLDQYRVTNKGQPLTTNVGRKISNDEDQLKAGIRGPSLLEDQQFFEKMTHFVKEEIPQRVVHPRGYGAHGDRKSTRLNSSHVAISYAVYCLKKKNFI